MINNWWNVLNQFILKVSKVYISFILHNEVWKFIREMIVMEWQEVSRERFINWKRRETKSL